METIKIFISGDFATRMRVEEAIKTGAYDTIFGDILPIIQKCDYAITNMESPITEKDTPIKKTGPNLKSPLKTADALKFAGFNMVTLANNHLMDQGVEGLMSTINALDKYCIEHIGAGCDVNEARRIHYVKIKGTQLSFINCCENEWSTTTGNTPGCNPLNEISLYYQIAEAKQNSDYLILIIHGGHENYGLPSPRMKKLYHWFIDLGADALIGHHTHCFSGHEIYKGHPIVYSLGNFIFDNSQKFKYTWFEGCAAIITIKDRNCDLELLPFYQCKNQVGIKLFSDKEKAEFSKLASEKSKIISDDNLLESEFSQFIKNIGTKYKMYLEPSQNKYILGAVKRGILPSLIKGVQKRLLLNLIRCESHREIVTSILSESED